MKIIFLDTNIFIQCRNLKQLPWDELFGDDEDLLLYITRAVQEEIDKHKQDGNSRRAKKARKVSSFLRRMILAEETKLIIKESKPKIEISFTPPLKNSIETPDIIDLSRPDDQIIFEIILYKHHNPEQNIALLSHDTNPLLTAKRCGLSYYVIPDDWLLPPESDSKDKKIIELEKLIKELQNNYPNIETLCINDSGEEIEKIDIKVTKYQEFSEGEIDQLIKSAKKRFPMETNFPKEPEESQSDTVTVLDTVSCMFGYTRKFVPANDEEISNYQKNKYPEWIDKVEVFFASLPQELENQTREVSFEVILSNTGNVPAENLIIEFKALGEIFLKPNKDDGKNDKKKDILSFPSPPDPPKGQWIKEKNSMLSMLESIGAMSSSHLKPYEPIYKNPPYPEALDRNAFYWKNGKSRMPVKSWKFECKEFRHKVEPELFEITVFIPSTKNNLKNAAIECLVSARNLPTPLKKIIGLNISYVNGNNLDEAKKCFQKILF